MYQYREDKVTLTRRQARTKRSQRWIRFTAQQVVLLQEEKPEIVFLCIDIVDLPPKDRLPAAHLAKMRETPERIDPINLTELFLPRAIRPSMVTPSLVFRTNIVQDVWNIPPGSRVLEIGCGQGDCSELAPTQVMCISRAPLASANSPLAIVLAAAVGPLGHIDAVDPAPPHCGGPINYGTSQRNLKASPLGPRMTFHNTDPEDYLASYAGEPYDYVVFFLSLWFFSDPSRIERLLARLSSDHGRFAKRLLIAEWALEANSPEAWPHVLAALSIANLETRNIEDKSNICSPVSPAWVRALFASMELEVEKEEVVPPSTDLREGMWEVRVILQKSHGARIKEVHKDNERARLAAEAMQQAVMAAVDRVEGGVDAVQSMNVWTCVIPLGLLSSSTKAVRNRHK